MTSGSYDDEPARNRMVLSLARLWSESGVVEVKYDRNEESFRVEA